MFPNKNVQLGERHLQALYLARFPEQAINDQQLTFSCVVQSAFPSSRSTA